MYTYYVNGINIAKDYKKYSYNKRILIEKNVNDKKTLQIQIMFQNCFKILEFQEFFITYIWVIMYMMY
jgi:hypothetical protein